MSWSPFEIYPANCVLCSPEKELCQHDDIQSEFWSVVDCPECGTLMFMLKRHDTRVLPEEAAEAEILRFENFPSCKWKKDQTEIQGHAHWHLL